MSQARRTAFARRNSPPVTKAPSPPARQNFQRLEISPNDTSNDWKNPDHAPICQMSRLDPAAFKG
jgi:hypothetical protein